MSSLFILACLTLGTVPGFFIWNRVYKDGVFGRASLGGVMFFSWTFLLEAAFGEGEYDLSMQTEGMVICFAVFLVWHLGRFHARVLKREAQ